MITAMMLAAIAVTLIAGILVQQRYSIRLTQNFQDLEQAYQYAYAAEDLVAVWLQRDAEQNKNDSVHDLWGQPREPFEIDDDDGLPIGELITQIEDAQAYLNLNNLLSKDPRNMPPLAEDGSVEQQAAENPEFNKPHEGMMNAFGRLFVALGIPAEFRFSILDWIDPNEQLADPSSAESSDYLALDPPYRAANKVLSDPSELKLLRIPGISDDKQRDDMLAALLPHVVALPTPTAVNVNTATRATLIAIGLTPDQADQVINRQQVGPIESKSEIKQMLPGADNAALQVLSVESNYFRLSGQVRLGKSRLFLNSLLFRSPEGEVRVIMRQFSRVPRVKTDNPALAG